MPVSASYVTSRDYEERVYAGVLGKIIGVYLGRPFEGWQNDKIEKELGEINYYVNERLGAPLVVTDDDISGTFTFLRALAENGNNPNLTAEQIGDWWLNTLINQKTILWWGGMGQSTEHTAYLRLKSGIKAPNSGSIATNGKMIAEQIGAQIFIDGWGMVSPGDPEQAASFARRAGSVSHDGEAIYGAQVVAAMEAQAFVESDINKLLDTAVTFIPKDSTIYRLIADIREWAEANGDDWRATLKQIQAKYGYDKYRGNCHMVPNHALIILGLLHGNDDFQLSQMITNTAGWDTDCNAANVGCLMGIKNGLAGINAGPDWRGPVADRIYLPTADGGRAITDAVRETYFIVNSARALASQSETAPKSGARFHFSLPGSVQGFEPDKAVEVQGTVALSNEDGRLAINLTKVGKGRPARVGTGTFIPPSMMDTGGYDVIASPTLYSGQIATARIAAATDLSSPVSANLYVRVYETKKKLNLVRGESQIIAPGEDGVLTWLIPDTGGQPIAEIGIEVSSENSVSGEVFLDSLTWNGAPNVTLGKPEGASDVWNLAWVNGVDQLNIEWTSPGMTFKVIQNEGTGLVTQGESSWTGYTASTEIKPHFGGAGLVACACGLRRYVAVVLDTDYRVRLIEQHDSDRRILAESDFRWETLEKYPVSITINHGRITAKVGTATLVATAPTTRQSGAVGMLVDTGSAEFAAMRVEPATD